MHDDRRLHDMLADHVLGLLRPDDAARVEQALAVSPELRAEAAALRSALFALPDALEPQPPSGRAWEALHARLHGDPVVSPPAGAGAAVARERTPSAAPPRAVPALTLALSVVVMLLAGTAGWGWTQRGQAALAAHEEAVVAYWMRYPDLLITPLEPVAGAHAGVVCVLPDGRAMVLQPHAPAAGRDYVLYGDTAAGRIELGRTRGRLITFQAAGVQAVNLVLEGATGGPVAHASLR